VYPEPRLADWWQPVPMFCSSMANLIISANATSVIGVWWIDKMAKSHSVFSLSMGAIPYRS